MLLAFRQQNKVDVERLSVVSNLHQDARPVALEDDLGHFSLGVPHDVRQRLLRHAIENRPLPHIQVLQIGDRNQLDGEVRPILHSGDKGAQGGHEAEIVQEGGS